MNQGLYLESISAMTKEFLGQKDFEAFVGATKTTLLSLLNKSQDKDTIRRAIIDFMAQRGIKAIVIFDKQIIDIKTSIQNREKNAYIDFLVRYLEGQNYAKKMQNNKNYLKEIFTYMQQHSTINDESLIKDIVRGALKKILKLNERDGLFFNNLEPFVKNFDFELVENNTKIRKLQKSSHIEALLDDTTKAKIKAALKNTQLEAISRRIVQEIINEKLFGMSVIDFLRSFSFLYIQALSKEILRITSGDFEQYTIDCYCVESYRLSKNYICDILSSEVLGYLELDKQAARDFVMFFSKREIRLNGRLIHIPLIQDAGSKIWNLSDIEAILHAESSINGAIKTQRAKIAQIEEQIVDIQKSLHKNEMLIAEKQRQIQILSNEYDAKKAQSIAYQKADVETRNAMTKIINGILQDKIHALDAITVFKTEETTLKEKKNELDEAKKVAENDITRIIQENKEGIQRLQNLLDAFSFCIGKVIEELDDNV